MREQVLAGYREVFETSSFAEATVLCRAGWVVAAVTRGRRENGDDLIIYWLGRTPRPASRPFPVH